MTRINTNISSLLAQNSLANSNNELQTAMTRLSTGLKINSGADDPAGLIASTALQNNITSVNSAISNSQLADQMIATADGGLGQVSTLLNNIQSLVTQAANNGAMSSDQIAADQLQINSSLNAINSIAQSTSFQGKQLLDGSLGFTVDKGAGANSANLTSLQINQANLGASNSLAVQANITQAATTAQLNATIADVGGNAQTASANITLNGGGGGSITIDAPGTGAQYNNVNVKFNEVHGQGASTPSASYDATTQTLNINVDDTNATTATAIAQAITSDTNFTVAGTPTGSFDPSLDTPTTKLAVAATAKISTANGGSFQVTSTQTGTLGDNLNVVFVEATGQGAGTATASYTAGTNTLQIQVHNAGSTTVGTIVNAINTLNAAHPGTDQFTAQSLTAGSYVHGTDSPTTTGGNPATLSATLADGTALTFSTLANTAAYNAATVQIVESLAANATPTATWNGTANGGAGSLTIDVAATGTTSAASIQSAVNGAQASGSPFQMTYVAGSSGNYDASTVQATTNVTTAGGGAFSVTSTQAGTAGNALRVKIVESAGQGAGTATAAYIAGSNTLQVTVHNAGNTGVGTIVGAINTLNQSLPGTYQFTASTVTAGNYVHAVDTAGTVGTAAVLTAPALNDGTVMTFTTSLNTASHNAATIQIDDDLGASATPTASWNAAANGGAGALTIHVAGSGTTAVSDIQTAVNGAAGNPFQMTFATGTTYDPASDSGVLTAATTPGTAGVNPLNGSATGLTAGGLNADTAILTAATTPGTAGVDPQLGVGGITTGGTDALQGADTTLQGGQNAGGGLAANVTFQLTGSLGSQVFSFQTGTDIAQIVSAINADSDSTGVGAQAGTDSGTATPLLLNSTTFGSTGTVAVNVISEGAGGTFGSSLKNALGVAATQATGSDIQGTINGLAASGSGNTLSVDSPSLSMTMTVADGSSTQVNFNITGGGALFQLGPDVTSAEQARLGIESIDTSNLGGSAGLLYTLGSGGTAALAATGGTAAANQIVDQAVSQISDLRGRLGAFQSTTLQTNINALQNTVQDLTSAQSSIQDADFAAETANVTRAQILVQSGTSVLAIANKNPQNVLTLLQGL